MDYNVALAKPENKVEDDSAAVNAFDANTRVEHYAMDQPTPKGDADELDGGWYFYKV